MPPPVPLEDRVMRKEKVLTLFSARMQKKCRSAKSVFTADVDEDLAA
jgi:hypothetical protein